uniref:ATP synthase subunit delta n=1 Tax=Candidatus Kentrum sp. TUN TaxID=2126343 RepID=A0A450ZG92_9GAMM|nr:MAG: ATP synthase F1 subcomplex delta subunit [Candidatus Kentron sp. TUN]VFK52780.1 MAG: ATP synthase F1 subcomplex delta subunit [Candidatus Kentron sp. TUN]VFK57851.1 MAG: ATP synthase F1 subcomplex delta subunit [Candidatus Kentron sp. TUN]
MAEKYTLARPYALAAFKQAQEEGKLDRWFEMLRFLEVVTANQEMVKIIKDPRVSKSRLVALVLDIAKGRLSKTGENFVRLLVDAGRVDVVQEILQLFEKELDVFKKRVRARVISAYPLTSAYQQDISLAMAKRLGREVILSVAVDRSLIGGVVIRVEDVILDMSLRGRLTQLGLDLS